MVKKLKMASTRCLPFSDADICRHTPAKDVTAPKRFVCGSPEELASRGKANGRIPQPNNVEYSVRSWRQSPGDVPIRMDAKSWLLAKKCAAAAGCTTTDDYCVTAEKGREMLAALKDAKAAIDKLLPLLAKGQGLKAEGQLTSMSRHSMGPNTNG